jgi:hypothetical protein
MHGFQGAFPCCKSCLPSNSSQRCLVLEAIILIQNFQNDYVGYSQIKTVFDREYVRSQNLHGYNQISQYYFHLSKYDSELDGARDGAGDGVESDNNSNIR